MENDGLFSRVNVVLVMTYGSLEARKTGSTISFFQPADGLFAATGVCFAVHLYKRQIMRLAMKSRRGPHAPIGHNAPKELKQLIEAKLGQVRKIHFEPRLLSPDDDRLTQLPQSGSHDYLYRMKALDAAQDTELPFRELGGTPTAITGKIFRTWLLQLRNSHRGCRDEQRSLIDTVLDGYNRARHGAEAFGEAEFLKYQEALTELASIVRSSGGTSSQDHQSAAIDLTGTTEPTSPFSSPTQTTYLTSAAQQRSKRARPFLELKNFKDNYNTLDSTL